MNGDGLPAFNYNDQAVIDDGSCEAIIVGCTNQSFIEYDALANTSSPGLCLTPAILGCTDVNAFNYDVDANQDDGSCEDILVGCTDSLFLEFDVTANTQSFDGEGNNVYCVTVVYGCTILIH